ncbi:hypothetical protein BBJ28_00011703 [Nothophytophthora sp. Chile5]|nr:hypothetical protein BBJ28_00011703 [Nothophytophthora sp. Chile5]
MSNRFFRAATRAVAAMRDGGPPATLDAEGAEQRDASRADKGRGSDGYYDGDVSDAGVRGGDADALKGPENTVGSDAIEGNRGGNCSVEPSDAGMEGATETGENTAVYQPQTSEHSSHHSRRASQKKKAKVGVVVPIPSALDEMIDSTLGVNFNDERMTSRKTTMTTLHEDAVDHQKIKASYQRVGRALEGVLCALPVTEMSPELSETIKCLTASDQTLDMRFIQELRDLSAVLQADPVPRLSRKCHEAIERMAEDGQMIEMRFVEELSDAKVLTFCTSPPEEQYRAAQEERLAELCAAIAACAIATLASSPAQELLVLWSIVHSSISAAVGAEALEAATHGEKHESEDTNEHFSTPMQLAIRPPDLVRLEELVDNEVMESPIAQSLARQSLSGLKGKLALSRQGVDAALQAMREGRAMMLGGWLMSLGLPPLLRLEIVRDFFQITGLFFSEMYGPVLAFIERQQVPSLVYTVIRWLRNIYSILAMDASVLMRYLDLYSSAWATVGVSLLLISILLVHWSFVLAVFSLWWKMPRVADGVRHGHEATTWAAFASRNKWMTRAATVFITVCLTFYLPLTQMSFNVLVVTSHPENEAAAASVRFASQYRSGPYWFFFPLEAILLLFTFTLTLPILLVWSIKTNQPSGSLENENFTHDLDGDMVMFDDRVYTQLVASDPSQLGCPYRSLYAGFERNWSTYKVMQMVAKVVLAIIVVAVGKYIHVGGTLISGFYFFVVVLSWLSEPFTDPLDDFMEFFSKCTALATAIGGTAAAYVEQKEDASAFTAAGLQVVMGIVVFAHSANLVIMLAALLLGMDTTRLLMKKVIGWLSFSDTSRGLEDVRAKHAVPKWDLQKEAKHRVWQAFWRAVLLELAETEEGSIPQDQGKENATEKITGVARLAKLEEAVVASGFERVLSHWRGKEQTYTTQLRRLARDVLEGVDVFWDNPKGARDGHLDSISCFGKMYVVPYPFHCVVVYDDAADEAIVRDDFKESAPLHSSHCNLAKLLSLNFTPTIMAKRELRQKLRILSDRKTEINFPFARIETVWLGPKLQGWWGFLPILTMPGVYKFKCHYSSGVLKVETSADKTGMLRMFTTGDKIQRKMADGFAVTMAYEGGWGEVEVPHGSGRWYRIESRKAVVKADHIGLKSNMEESDELRTIFAETRIDWEEALETLRKQHQEYRRGLAKAEADANAALSDGFWHFVYNNPHLPRDELEKYLTEREQSPALRSLPETHASALDALYLRRDWVFKHPMITFWYVFWDDVYARNSGLKCLRPEDFDPLQPTAICYRVMSRKRLEDWLRERNLCKCWSLFNPRLLGLLYEEMERHRVTDQKKKTDVTGEEGRTVWGWLLKLLCEKVEKYRATPPMTDVKSEEERKPRKAGKLYKA